MSRMFGEFVRYSWFGEKQRVILNDVYEEEGMPIL